MHPTSSPANPMRRRLAKGGLAAPVVLASLASKNALAGAPYKCTVSGKMSGNYSPGATGHNSSVVCSSLGNSCATWAGACKNDPKTFVNCGFPDNYNGKISGSKCYLGDKQQTSGWQKPATCYHVLSHSGTVGSPLNPLLAKQALCAYLNAGLLGAEYPVTGAECVTIYKTAVSTGTSTCVIRGKTLTAADCSDYLQLLFRA